VAGKEKLDVQESTMTANVSLGIDGQAFGLAVTLVGQFPALEEAEARELMDKAHQVCPYSRATRGNIEVTLEVAPHYAI
jgi:Ohr subfamily peroxiredoxin